MADDDEAIAIRNIAPGDKSSPRTEADSRPTREALHLAEMAEAMAGVGHWRIDARTMEPTWSREVFRIYGVDPANGPIGLNEAIEAFHPEDRAMINASVDAALRNGAPWAFEARLIRPDGDLRYVAGRGACERDAEGGLVAIYGAFLDVTDAKQAQRALQASEFRLRLLAEHANDIIMESDLEGRLIYVSPSVRALTGFSSEELVGKLYSQVMHRDDVAGVNAARAQALTLARGTSLARCEYRARNRAGHWLWFEACPLPIDDPETGQPIGFLDISRDITGRKAMEEELARKCAEAEAASVAKSEFLANMSHEIRTPLTGVIGFSNLLATMAGLPETAARYAHTISTAGQTLLAVVNDILDFSKLEAGQLTLDPGKFEPFPFVEETAALVAAQVEAKGLTLTVRGEDDIPALVQADSSRLRQVLLNLLTNAIKFTQAGAVAIDVGYDRADGGRLRLAVSDTGGGIPEDLHGRLFQRFSQLDGSISRQHGGTGLGLAICKGIVELMGGDIGMESRAGDGSTFWFTIAAPLAEVDATPAEEQAEDIQGRSAHVLIVDDVAVNRELVLTLLGAMGHTFEEAASGAQAVEAAARTAFDVILMDLQMPGMDGMAATRLVRATPGPNRDVPIIAFSANVLETHVAASREAGMNDHIAKPISPAQLLEKVGYWIDPAQVACKEKRCVG
jgi:PAS domain S-box-containing protein